jgi:3-dehydroquinate synthase
MLTVDVPLPDRSYPVHIGSGLLSASAFRRWRGLGDFRRALIVTDTNVGPLYAESLRTQIASLGADVQVCALPAGEQYKTLDSLSRIWAAALANGSDRGLVIFALGGGVVGDMAGFAAATVLRGVRFVQVPTSLLAMVDSSVGGKTGINHVHGKNLIGAFKQPELVVADVTTLQTLPSRELRAGLAEAVKTGAVLDAALLDRIERDVAPLLAVHPDALLPVIASCCTRKAEVVARDELEAGPRQVLNFGHTFGHAIERCSGYGTVLHGEAIAIGMVLAARVAELHWKFAPTMRGRLRDILNALKLPTLWPADLSVDAVADAVVHDKKVRGDNVVFVLCPRWGEARLVAIPLAGVRALLHEAVDGL